MTTPSVPVPGNHPYVLVVGMDYSELGDAALDEALRIASAHEHAQVHPVFVERDFRQDPLEAAAAVDAAGPRAEHALDELERHCKTRIAAVLPPQPIPDDHRPPHRVERVVTHVRLGAPAAQIVQLAVDVDADLIVVGTHGRKGLDRLVMGSVAERVVRTARCPVLVVRHKDHENVGHVPEIEPPCPDCLETRKETAGKEMWCSRHAHRMHIKPHRYTYVRSGEYASTDPRRF